MSNVINVTESNYRQEVVDAPGVVLVDFWAPWCGPCKKLGPILESLAAEYGDRIKVAKVNVDEERTLGMMHQIMSIPTVMIYSDGEKVDEFAGLQPQDSIAQRVDAHL